MPKGKGTDLRLNRLQNTKQILPVYAVISLHQIDHKHICNSCLPILFHYTVDSDVQIKGGRLIKLSN